MATQDETFFRIRPQYLEVCDHHTNTFPTKGRLRYVIIIDIHQIYIQ